MGDCLLSPPPLSLYIHIPWCLEKCPYCDFNSHAVNSPIPEADYVQHLLRDLAVEAALVGDRPVHSVFFGGGTPSLLSPEAIALILDGVAARVNLPADAEITLEANPGTIEQQRFTGFAQAGINRISMGVQSFNGEHLLVLGRIHDGQQALDAIAQAQQLPFNSVNLDLMHGLPRQDLHLALADLQCAISLNVPHLSWYQLTIEPNTLFFSKPPTLPDDEVLWDIQEQGQALLAAAGYQQYEISGYCQPQQECQHNLNYWRFGDYLGIGCGAHGKITQAATGTIERRVKIKHPRGYMAGDVHLSQSWPVASDDLPLEFFMNHLRLHEPCPIERFEATTGIAANAVQVQSFIDRAEQKGLLTVSEATWQTTALGKRFLNELLNLD